MSLGEVAFPGRIATRPVYPRIAMVDALRGGALVAMFTYHLIWDFGYFGFIPPEWPYSTPFKIYGHFIAGTFFALVGASLVLATRDGIDWNAYFRRLAAVAAAAAAISAATYWFAPDAFIFFGILHCIVVCSLLALPLLRAPLWLVVAAALLVLLLPLVAATPALDNYFGWSLGLSADEPRTLDWRPLLPWAAATFAGLVLTRALLARGFETRLAAWQARSRPTRWLTWGGRHSLFVYLVHQPIFLAILFAVAWAAGPAAAPAPSGADATEIETFVTSCRAQCAAVSAQENSCTAICGCVAERAHTQSTLWHAMIANKMSSDSQKTIDGIVQQCSAAAVR